MIETKKALEIILQNTPILDAIEVPFEESLGYVLRESVFSDRALPPFDRVMYDGISIRFEDWKKGVRSYQLEGSQFAGEPQKKASGSEDICFEVMTGAMLPLGFDTVIPFESCEQQEGFYEVSEDAEVAVGGYIHKKGSDYWKGEELLSSGTRLDSTSIPVLASCNYSKVKVSKPVKVALVSTGDELVEVGEPIEEYQIRQSNRWAVAAALKALGIEKISMFHFKDEKDGIRSELRRVVDEYDVVIVSGGISKGKKDFLPDCIKDVGVEMKFQWVRQRPGKPMGFGVGKDQTLVFALPGNPLSTISCCHYYVVPALRQMMGLSRTPVKMVELGEAFQFKPPFEYFLPVQLKADGNKLVAMPCAPQNSGDYASIVGTDGFVLMNGVSQDTFDQGSILTFTPWL